MIWTTYPDRICYRIRTTYPDGICYRPGVMIASAACPLGESGWSDPDTSVRRSWNALFSYPASCVGCKISGCNSGGSRFPDVIHPGGKRRQPLHLDETIASYPDMLSGCPPMVYPDALSGYTPCMDSKQLSSISDCFGDQQAIKTPKLNTFFIRIDCKGP